MGRERSKTGATPVTNFRLPADVLASLDAVAADLTAKTGAGHTRTDAVKALAFAGLPKIGHQAAMLPHFGDIPCGQPVTLGDEPPAMMMDLAALFRGPDRFLLTARGTSMTNNLIADGDLLVIARQQTAVHGQTVAAIVDGEATLKFYHVRKNGKKTEHWLSPASDHHQPKLIQPGADVRVIGVLVGVIRKC